MIQPYIPENFLFRPEELWPPSEFQYLSGRFGRIGMMQFWRGEILYTLQRMRLRYGVIEINTWLWGRPLQYRGWRPKDCVDGAKDSMHKYYLAIDMWFKDTTSDKVRKDIINDPWCEDFKHITAIELDTSHLHIDFRNHDKQKHGLLLVPRP